MNCKNCNIEINESTKSNAKKIRKLCLLCQNLRRKNAKATQRKIAMSHYGDSCICCTETEFKFLTFDHINNDGNVFRKQFGQRSSTLVSWIIKQDYPNSIQILCYNCNNVKAIYGTCIHSERKNNVSL